jgi:ABC-2 type transport system permease protein
MRSWSEERKSGTIELLMTLPISTWQAMLAKHFAAWAVLGLSLFLTFPLWITVNYLGTQIMALLPPLISAVG